MTDDQTTETLKKLYEEFMKMWDRNAKLKQDNKVLKKNVTRLQELCRDLRELLEEHVKESKWLQEEYSKIV